jgi:arylsulfatase B
MIRAGEPTIGEVFSKAGYATGMFGKWHLGDNYPFRPEDRGYTHVLRHGGGGVGQTPDYWDNAYFDDTYFLNGKPTKFKGFCTDVFFENAKLFIAEQADAKKPFVAYISTNAPHGPLHSPEASAAKYAQQPKNVANFFGMIDNIDDNVGKLRAFLDEKQLTENTIFIFTTDNGTATGEKVFNAGLRGRKGSQFDGGHRVPFFLHWPAGGINRPVDVQPLTHAVDVLPTLIDLCKIKPTKDHRFDGVSVKSLLIGTPDQDVDWNNRIMITDSQRVKDPVMWKSSAVMTSRWRLIDGEKLYDMDSDPGQKRDVATAFPAEVRQLRAGYQTWWEELKPSFKDATAIIVGHPADNPARLTSHDWITEKSTPWNQMLVRRGMNEPENVGFWNIEVATTGKYRIRLRRWPEEAKANLNEKLPAGLPVPGQKPYRMTPGKGFEFSSASLKVGENTLKKSVSPNDVEVVFETDLKAGKTSLEAKLITTNDEKVGAFYVYVEKLKD